MKFNKRLIALGFILPLIGIVFGYVLMEKNEMVGRSVRKGSALSTLIIILGIFIWFIFLMF